MATRIMIDSGSDILPWEAEKLGLIHLPMTVTFGETEYRDGVDLSHREFYEKLIESDTLPITSQITPSAFEDVLEQIPPEDDAVILCLSSALSGTYQSAMIAAEHYPGRVYVVDTKSVCVGERLLALRAVEMREQGAPAEEIAEVLTREREELRVMAVLDTLEYLKKGGRISSAVAFAGSLLSIKPVVAVDEKGEVALVGKARGSQNSNNLLRELIRKCGGVDYERPFALAYSGLSDALMRKYIEDSGDLWQGHARELPVTTVGCTIGTHVGPGAIAVAFFAKP